jgi:hypothetical protein
MYRIVHLEQLSKSRHISLTGAHNLNDLSGLLREMAAPDIDAKRKRSPSPPSSPSPFTRQRRNKTPSSSPSLSRSASTSTDDQSLLEPDRDERASKCHREDYARACASDALRR